jgi:predicted outer membrane repeat protein
MKAARLSIQRSLLSLAVMAAFAAPGAYAATITADPLAPDSDGSVLDTKCSLREAVLSVNTGADTGDCIAGILEAYGTNDSITLPAGTYNLTRTGLDETHTATIPYTVVNTPDTAIGDIDIQKSVRILGAAANTTVIQWDASVPDADRDRLFHIFTTTADAVVNVVIDSVTLQGGRTFQEFIAFGPDDPASAAVGDTEYLLRRAGGGLAVGPAANVVLVDPWLVGAESAEDEGGTGGGKPPGVGDEEGAATFSLILTGVKVLANQAQGDGAGIYNAAPMTATRVVVSGNTSTVNGGGIYNEGLTSITDSTISNNAAEGGGGVFLTGAEPVNFSGVTLSGNRAVGGGAVSGRSGVAVSMVNSTISGNLAEDVGAGFYANGPTTLRFVTIANNIAGADSPAAGVGINAFPSGSVAVSLKNVLLSANLKGWEFATYPDPADDPTLLPANCGYTGGATGAITSAGNNLSSDASCTLDLDDTTDLNEIDPKIGDLADNGGLTLTHKLLAGSPALGAGGAVAGVSLDQRGVTRDATPDIGAYEEPSAAIGGGGGGCTVNPGAQFDGGLLGLLAAAMGGLMLRRRRTGR